MLKALSEARLESSLLLQEQRLFYQQCLPYFWVIDTSHVEEQTTILFIFALLASVAEFYQLFFADTSNQQKTLQGSRR